jgi:hypothetical protein
MPWKTLTRDCEAREFFCSSVWISTVAVEIRLVAEASRVRARFASTLEPPWVEEELEEPPWVEEELEELP